MRIWVRFLTCSGLIIGQSRPCTVAQLAAHAFQTRSSQNSRQWENRALRWPAVQSSDWVRHGQLLTQQGRQREFSRGKVEGQASFAKECQSEPLQRRSQPECEQESDTSGHSAAWEIRDQAEGVAWACGTVTWSRLRRVSCEDQQTRAKFEIRPK